jgi:hypothetical protein
MTKILATILCVACFAVAALAQTAQVAVPRESQRAETIQTVGDTRVAIVYHRPNTKGRKIFGEGKDFLVPFGQVWRTGANENTTFEVTQAVKINGQELPAGKYGLHTIPGKDEWIVIFSKDNDKWGSYSYKPEQDALRVRVKPQTASHAHDTMTIDFDAITPTTTTVAIKWEKLSVPFTVDAGDVQGRTLARLKQQAAAADASNQQAYLTAKMTAANYILDNKIKASYADAATWIDESLKVREAFGTLRAKARMSAEMGNFKDAVMYGDKAVAAGKAATPPVNAEALANFEKDLATWKTKN